MFDKVKHICITTPKLNFGTPKHICFASSNFILSFGKIEQRRIEQYFVE